MIDILKPSFVKYFLRDYFNIPTTEMLENLETKTQELTDRWIKSRYTDISIYSSDDYIYDCALCYIDWTRAAIRSTKKVLPVLGSILDYYNGIGLSSIQIKKSWPDAQVDYFNDVPPQIRFFEKYCRTFRFGDKINQDSLKKYDAVFLFEVFEHYEYPEIFFESVIHPRIKKYLVFTATFGQLDPGHFPKYHGIEGKKYGQRFAKFLVNLGYKKIYSGWNARPTIYENIN